MTGIVKPLIVRAVKVSSPSDGRKDVQVHIFSTCRQHETEALIPGIRVEFVVLMASADPPPPTFIFLHTRHRHFLQKKFSDSYTSAGSCYEALPERLQNVFSGGKFKGFILLMTSGKISFIIYRVSPFSLV